MQLGHASQVCNITKLSDKIKLPGSVAGSKSQAQQAQFRAKGKSAREMRASTTPSFEETRSANMRNLSKTSKNQIKIISCILYRGTHGKGSAGVAPKRMVEISRARSNATDELKELIFYTNIHLSKL